MSVTTVTAERTQSRSGLLPTLLPFHRSYEERGVMTIRSN
jgi:hypothetical protein